MHFNLNGEEKSFDGDANLPLLEYLKSIDSISTPKIECAGTRICGACTVQVDDKAVMSCSITMEKVKDKSVVTSDELDQMIQDVVSVSIRKIGTAECNYCIPETIMRARVFLKKNPAPTFEEALKVISRHLCHCIGHYKIARSLVNAAEILGDENKLLRFR
jgi:aerobic-type carbon monoxide dehydrogenase small subunit (CoxS/CutS family)